MNVRLRPLLAALLGLALLAGCAEPARPTAVAPPRAVAPAVTSVPPTATETAVPPPESATLPPAPSASPPPSATPAPSRTPTAALPPTPTPRLAALVYTVRPGDSLIALGQRFGVTPEAILAANDLVLSAAMQPGRELTIPPPLPRPARGGSFVVVPTPGLTLPPGREIGRSALDLPLLAYTVGDGPRAVVLIGGIHGGFEANTILLARRMLAEFTRAPGLLPPEITLHVIPNANPDGLYLGSGKVGDFAAEDLYAARYEGRLNGRGVDLNRNWECDWRARATWRNETVSGGDAPYSEPETAALRDYVLALRPAAVLLWHSAANGVYVPGCAETDPASLALAEGFAAAAGYPLYTSFDHYDVTGDAGDALAAAGIPALTVELRSWEGLDWEQNRRGVLALLALIAGGA